MLAINLELTLVDLEWKSEKYIIFCTPSIPETDV